MRPNVLTFTMAAADADGICLSQTPAAGGAQNLTINGALASGGVATMDVARHASVTAAGNESARTFTFTGTARNGDALTEAIAGPNATTVTTTKNFLTITQVQVDGDTVGAITVGSADEADTEWHVLDYNREDFNVSFAVERSSDANFTYGIEQTYHPIMDQGYVEGDEVAFAHATLTGETTNQDGSTTSPVVAFRLAVTAYVAGTATLRWIQAGIRG